jgi:hypothetical protein
MVMAATRNRNPWTSTCQYRIGKTIWRTADVPHQLPGNAQKQLQAPCTRPLCSKAEKDHQHLFQAQTFRRNNPPIRHAVTEVRRNGHRGPMLHQCHHRSHQAKLLLHRNCVKQRGSPFVGTKNKQTQDLYPLMLVGMFVEIFHRVRLAYGDGHSPRRPDQVLATQA